MTFKPDASPADTSASSDFIESPVFKLLLTSSLLARPFTESIGPERDLTLPEWRCLIALNAEGGLSNIEVSELTGLDEMTVSRALDRLRRNGRIERSRDESDGRRHLNKMTTSGRTTYRAVVKLARERQDAMVRGLSSGDVKTLERTLDKIIEQLRTGN